MNITITRRRGWRIPASAGLALLMIPALLSLSGRPVAESQPPPNRYIGAAQCKNCHQSKESGDQYGAWQKEKHAEAYAVLASDKAKAYGKERGIDDPQKSEKCLKCHVTAFGKPKEELHRSFDPTLGVQCETCHGPGEQHRRARMVAAAEADEKGGATPAYTVIPDDEVIKSPTQKTCLGCHNDESPGFKPFCFHKFAADIRHLNPQKPRTEAERAAILVCGCGEKCACKTGCEEGKCGVPPKPASGDKE